MQVVGWLGLGMELAGSFLALHAQGLCYRDISFSNVFFDPATGIPRISSSDTPEMNDR